MDEPSNTPRRRWITIALIAAGLLVGGALAYLFSSSGSQADTEQVTLTYVDGLLTDVRDNRLILKKDDGETQEFTIKATDAAALDINHLRSHSALGLRTRVYWEEGDEDRFVVRTEDAPIGDSDQQSAPVSKPLTARAARRITAGSRIDQITQIAGPPAKVRYATQKGRRIECWQWDLAPAKPGRRFEACIDPTTATVSRITANAPAAG